MTTDVWTDHECPNCEELRKLVHGRLSDGRQAALTSHIDQCPGCQGRLEEVACGGDAGFSDCVRGLDKADPPADSAFWKAIRQADAALTRSHAGGTTASTGELRLDFLKPTDTPGRIGRISSFDVARVIGRGGMGVVLHAFDPSLHRDVAVKILDPQLAGNEVARQRFCREARAAASVTHDNLVAVYQVDEDEGAGLPFLVMQLVNGESLEERLKRVGKLSVAEAVRVGMQAAAGLAAAHAIGLIHRDIKPGNILIEEGTDKVKLTDFGLARAAEDMKLTRSGFVAGTPLYMAPEQARGEEVDARADLFSLGSVLYEALAGTPPFDGKTPLAVLRRVADEAHRPLRKLNPDVPDWLEDLIDRLLAKAPADRVQTAAEVADALSSHYQCLQPATPEQTEACPLTRSASRIIGARRRSRLIAAAIIGVPFLLGAAAGGLGVWALDPKREVVVSVPIPGGVPADAPAADSLASGPEAMQPLSVNSGGIWSVATTGDGNTVAVGQEDGRVIVWERDSRRRLHTIDAHDGPVWAVDLSADGKTLISASDDGTAKVWDITGSARTVRKFQHQKSVRSAALSPSGTLLVTGDRGGTVRVWDVSSDGALEEFQHGGVISSVAFHPDGLTVASASTNKTAALWEIPTGRQRLTLTKHDGPVYAVSFSPDGDVLATAGWDRKLRLWDTNSGDQIGESIAAHDEGVWSVHFACCGRVLATAGEDGFVRVWDLDARKPMAQFARPNGMVHAVRFAPDGKTLLTGGRDGVLRAWKIRD